MKNKVKKPNPIFGILSLIFGIWTYVPVLNLIPLPYPILAVIFGKISQRKGAGYKLGSAGNILGTISLVVWCIVVAFAVLYGVCVGIMLIHGGKFPNISFANG